MERPLDIAFHNVQPSSSVEAVIREHVDKLTARHPNIIGCRVSVEALHKQHRTGNIPDVHITVSLPGKDLAVSHAPHHAKDRRVHTDVYAAVKDAFGAAEKQLQSHKPKGGQDATAPNGSALSGQVAQLIPGADHAFILNALGTQIYFHRDSFSRGDFASLRQGDAVHYVEADGDAGPVATKVWPA